MRDPIRMRYFWSGFTVGCVAATLFAPKSGAATEKYCLAKTHETTDLLIHQVDDLRDRFIKTIEQGKRQLQQRVNAFSAAVDAGAKAFKKAS